MSSICGSEPMREMRSSVLPQPASNRLLLRLPASNASLKWFRDDCMTGSSIHRQWTGGLDDDRGRVFNDPHQLLVGIDVDNPDGLSDGTVFQCLATYRQAHILGLDGDGDQVILMDGRFIDE